MDSSRPDLRKITRRTAFGLLGAGAVSVGLAAYLGPEEAQSQPPGRTGRNPLVAENELPGERWKRKGAGRVDDIARQIQGYASATSVGQGESIGFHVAVADGGAYDIGVYRLGHYGGAGSRLMTTSPSLSGKSRDLPVTDPESGLIDCDWPESWRLEIPADWLSGLYMAAFTDAAGRRSYTPFVVREPSRAADLLVVVPVTTYQAYNLWPADKVTGKNLYRGFLPDGTQGGAPERAMRVSFNRPYRGNGVPSWFELEKSFAYWAEKSGYDVSYATSIDLHEGRVDPANHRAIVFPGHDEYWSKPMRDLAERAVAGGTHLAFLAANNVYFHIRMDAKGRHVSCYKQPGLDPAPDSAGDTVRWRELDATSRAEQGLLGVQYNGILKDPAPLIVREADHWFWKGTGVRDGDALDGLVGVEADGYDAGCPAPAGERTLLSASPYPDKLGRGELVQNTGLVVGADGTMVFAAGTFHWGRALGEKGTVAKVVKKATKNVFHRMIAGSE